MYQMGRTGSAQHNPIKVGPFNKQAVPGLTIKDGRDPVSTSNQNRNRYYLLGPVWSGFREKNLSRPVRFEPVPFRFSIFLVLDRIIIICIQIPTKNLFFGLENLQMIQFHRYLT